ncbi:Cytosolic iron-sulfur assembly component 3, variant 2 [Balamuthia mandrillaris]
MEGFSSGLRLTGLDDHITPSQGCVNPLFVDGKKQTAAIDEDDAKLAAVDTTKRAKISLEDDGSYVELSGDGRKEVLETATITLNDCLACSGCITSAESVLISQQSSTEFLSKLAEKKSAGLVVVLSISPQARASIAAYYRLSLLETHQKLITFCKSLGADYVFDTSFSRDFALLESMFEFVSKYKQQQQLNQTESASSEETTARTRATRRDRNASNVNAVLPVLASACPGWVCYAEKKHHEVLPHISTAKSPQQVMGSLVKYFFSQQINHRPEKIYHTSVMPCFDKKLEASRNDFYNESLQTREVDCVLSSAELLDLIKEKGVDFPSLEPSPLDPLYYSSLLFSAFSLLTCLPLVFHFLTSNCYNRFTNTDPKELFGVRGGSGGYAECVFRYAAKELFGVDIPEDRPLEWKQGRNPNFQTVSLEVDGETKLTFAKAYGFSNIQSFLRRIRSKREKSPYDFIEVMACPSGCLNGGGQVRPQEGETPKQLVERLEDIYHQQTVLRPPQQNAAVQQLYGEWLQGEPYSDAARKVLHTQYHPVPKLTNALAIQW